MDNKIKCPYGYETCAPMTLVISENEWLRKIVSDLLSVYTEYASGDHRERFRMVLALTKIGMILDAERR